MKGLKLLFAVCLAPLMFHGAMADDNADAARAAVRRTSNNTATVSRQKASTDTSVQTTPTTSISRTTNIVNKSGTTAQRTTTARTGNVVHSTDRTQSLSQTTASRTAGSGVRNRTTMAAPITTRTPITSRATTTRVGTASRAATTTGTRAATTTSRATISRAASRNIARVADSDTQTAARDKITSSDAKKCREVYYSCMDEFCANKDAVLKRCACSTRIHEFDSVKKNLVAVEDKMLSFNQRLLTVNMDKEDAAALYKATEGEIAFNQKDTSQSKKMLDEIAKKLNTSFDDSNFDRSLSPISLSLNIDAAFDSIDSLQGTSTTSKSGTELYSAALPVCREMALEVCTDDELTIAESGYQMQIEQDCNTVAKSYQAQTDTARERVREGGALLDMSRLDIYQKRNSDDILTCKKKMLDMLTDSSVCGSDMGKCLDVSGQYIDPSTGEAFLTVNLINLGKLITRPTGDTTWTTAPGNTTFVSFLNSKKKFLEPAMGNCQDIADTVWTEFIEDALAQIKLAQDKKLEDVRQSCTTLTTQCLSETAQSLADFDARALSTFGVKADKTVNAMCADVTNACTALLQEVGTDGADTDWIGGMTEITNNNTYETILQTCREVGRACIVQVCTSISGNFGLCENIDSSVNRKSIINRKACWDEVVNCVAEAGTDKINEIMNDLLNKGTGDFYDELYGKQYIIRNAKNCTSIDLEKTAADKDTIERCVYDICTAEGRCPTKDGENGKDKYGKDYNEDSCKTCRIAEQIWGNCEAKPTTELGVGEHNQIRVPADKNTQTLLSWFATKTGTADATDNCRDTSCPAGQKYAWMSTTDESNTSFNWTCGSNDDNSNGSSDQSNTNKIWTCVTGGDASINNEVCTAGTYTPIDGTINCCPTSNYYEGDKNKTCLTTDSSAKITSALTPIYGTIRTSKEYPLMTTSYKLVATWNLAAPKNGYPDGDYALVCVDTNDDVTGDNPVSEDDKKAGYPNGKTIHCSGTFVAINLDTGHVFTPGKRDAKTNVVDSINSSGTHCIYTLASGQWQSCKTTDGEPDPCNTTIKQWRVKY
ncbi:MAG: hypothetical protein NC311_06235 [Muribaculaceae bacterium]|nr:hypothetical protein [Muribaculaceae bacterium]